MVKLTDASSSQKASIAPTSVDALGIANSALAASGSRSRDAFGRRAVLVMQRGIARAIAGDSAGAIADGLEAIGLYNRTVDAVDGQLTHRLLATLYTYAGRKDDAVEELRAVMRVPIVVTTHDLRLDPTWDPLRGHPGFERLVRGDR